MRELSGDYIGGASKHIREVGVKAVIGSKSYLADDIISIDIQSTISGGGFGIGTTPSDRLSLKLYGTGKVPKNTSIKVYTSINNSGYEQLGLFYCEECTQNGKITSITAYDKMYSQSKKLCKFTGVKSLGLSALSFPCTMQDMLDYICSFRKIDCEFECQPFVVQTKPMKSETEYYTVREILGFIASAHGCNARFNLDGKLIFKDFLEASPKIAISDVIDQNIDDDEPFTVNGIAFNVNNEPQIYIDDTEGSEYDEEAEGVISVDNPMASIEIAEYVWQKLGNMSYFGGNITIRGTGAIECGDLIEVENFKNPDSSDSYVLCITDIAYSINRNNGFMETLTSKRNIVGTKASGTKQSDKPSPSPSSILSQVSFEKNCLFYSGEVYHLQFGWNKRIMCVTKGNKYAIINSQDYTESRIEAATAVMNGLTEDWNIEFDYFAISGSTFNLSEYILYGYSDSVKCDWGDGTINEETSHTYGITAPVRVKIKYLSGVPTSLSTNFNFLSWKDDSNPDVSKGASLYIGGGVQIILVNCGNYAERVMFGESVKVINPYTMSGSYSKVEHGHEYGIPPFVEKICGYALQEASCGYLYIPESCTKIEQGAFSRHHISEIEIEENGEQLEIGNNAFGKPETDNGFTRIDYAYIPARVKWTGNMLYKAGIGAVKFGKGVTSIDAGATYEMVDSVSCFKSEFLSKPCFIFIPDTVTSIGAFLISRNSTRKIYIICEGKWSDITKESQWDGGNTNVEIIESSYLYNHTDTVLEYFVRGK